MIAHGTASIGGATTIPRWRSRPDTEGDTARGSIAVLPPQGTITDAQKSSCRLSFANRADITCVGVIQAPLTMNA